MDTEALSCFRLLYDDDDDEPMTLCMTTESIHLLPRVKCNSHIIVYSKFSTRNYSIAHRARDAVGLPSSEDISCVLRASCTFFYLTYLVSRYLFTH